MGAVDAELDVAAVDDLVDPGESALAYRRAFCEQLTPPPVLTVSEWSDRYRILSGKYADEPGPWRTDRTPYLREIMDRLSVHDPTEIIVFRKGAQIGATEAGNNWLGYIIDHAPGPVLFIQPTEPQAKRLSKQRIGPMIQDCPRLRDRIVDARKRDSGNTTLMKEFAGGALFITGANSASPLRGTPVRNLYADEVDAWPADVDGQGDPLELARTRTNAFRRRRKIYISSTPTETETSRVLDWYDRGDRRRYYVPCPHCGAEQLITWSSVRWDKTETEAGDAVHHPETAHMICSSCGERIEEHHKATMLPAGAWRPTKRPRDRRVKSYYLSALYSPLGMYSWSDAVADFLEAWREFKRGDPRKLIAWSNSVLGDGWDEPADKVEPDPLFARREKYPAPVPAGVVLLTCGVDVQKDRLELEVIGWAPDYEHWGIDYKVLWGDTNRPEVWEQLDLALAQTYLHESGAKLGLAGTIVDARYRMHQVVEFCRTRTGRRIWPGQGKDGEGRPLVSSPSAKRTGRNRRPVRMFTLGVDAIKSLVYSRLRITSPGPNYAHFPISADYDDEYFSQLTAEHVVTRRRRGRPVRVWVAKRRNEALDCRAYGTAAVVILGDTALAAASKRLARRQTPKAAAPENTNPIARRQQARRRRGSWATNWKK